MATNGRATGGGQNCNFSDLGSGLSFIFPILVSLGEADMTFIEQPELHLHPKAQAEIGDVLLAAKARNRRSIIETHSEQMIMRISNRIRQTSPSSEDSNENIQSIRPEFEVEAHAIRIYFFEQGKNRNDGTEVQEIEFAPDGSLLDKWPNNFFDEDDIHAFSRLKLFSSLAEADMKFVRGRWPWIDKLKDPIRRWFVGAAHSTRNEDYYRVVFPIYASKIAEKLIIDKLLDPFKKIHKLDNRETNKFFKNIHDYLDEGSWKAKLKALKAAPTLGACLRFIAASKGTHPRIKTDIKLCKDFRDFLESFPEEERKTLWFNEELFIQLENLNDIRGGSAHTNDSNMDWVKKQVEPLLINEREPGILLRAFGYFPEFYGH